MQAARAPVVGSMWRVVSRRGLSRGVVSRDFSTAELVRALQHDKPTVYMELDSEGRLVESGVRGCAAGVRGGLAPDVGAWSLALEAGARGWRLRVLADLPPHHDLQLWFHDALLAALDMPFLTLQNIKGEKSYECHLCGEQFERPNSLKVHLFLSCGEFTPQSFWKLFLSRLASLERVTSPTTPPCTSSVSGSPRALHYPPGPEQLEALAAEWGRSRDGHRCLYCGKLYSRKYGLKIHIRTHTGYKPLRCRHCARAFGDPSNLNKHVRLHAAREPPRLACRRCPRRLARRRDLERHERTHHAPD